MVRQSAFDDNPVRVLYGDGAVSQLWAVAENIAQGPALVVCGRNVSRQGWFEELVASAHGAVRVFDQVEPDPSDETIAAGGVAGAEAGATLVVGVGGGSSMDATKAIAVEAVAPGWVATQDRPGEPTSISITPLPTILVPTTAGTGSEVTPFSVVTFRQSRRKLALSHPALHARYAILDSTLLLSAPALARAAAGLDALTHAVESFASRLADPQSRARAYWAAQEIRVHLVAACGESPSPSALARLQWAAMIAGLAFTHTRLGIVHAMALPLSALFHVPHGIANAILLPYGMRYNATHAPQTYAELARALGETAETTDVAARAAHLVRELAQAVGAPCCMAEAGVKEEAIPQMAREAIKSAHIKVNPRPLAVEDLIEVYRQAMWGEW